MASDNWYLSVFIWYLFIVLTAMNLNTTHICPKEKKIDQVCLYNVGQTQTHKLQHKKKRKHNWQYAW